MADLEREIMTIWHRFAKNKFCKINRCQRHSSTCQLDEGDKVSVEHLDLCKGFDEILRDLLLRAVEIYSPERECTQKGS